VLWASKRGTVQTGFIRGRGITGEEKKRTGTERMGPAEKGKKTHTDEVCQLAAKERQEFGELKWEKRRCWGGPPTESE